MGAGTWNPSSFTDYAKESGYDTKSIEQVINRSKVNPDFLPVNFRNGLRESCDSIDNPNSTPIMICGDVTGSMGQYAGMLIKQGINQLATELNNSSRVTVPDPHLMFVAVGDALTDHVPIQGTQFEADLRIIQQLEQIYVEGNGGGNDSESYSLGWALAAFNTKIDSWDKRGKRGVCISYGDERVSAPIPKYRVKELLGVDIEQDYLTADKALKWASERFDVYHLLIEQGSYAKNHPGLITEWQNFMGQRAISVPDVEQLPEIIIDLLQQRDA